MAAATFGFLRCNMDAPILRTMPVLRAFRAIIILLGFLAVAPVQAAGVASDVNAVVSAGCHEAAQATDPGTGKSAAMLAHCQLNQSSPDDGYSPLANVLTSPATIVTGSGRLIEAPLPHASTHFRLDRPPKFV